MHNRKDADVSLAPLMLQIFPGERQNHNKKKNKKKSQAEAATTISSHHVALYIYLCGMCNPPVRSRERV